MRRYRNPVLAQLVDEGRYAGRSEAKADAVIAVLKARGLDVPDGFAERVRSCDDHARLDRWLRRATTAERAEDLKFSNPVRCKIIAEGRVEGKADAKARAVLAVLKARRIDVASALAERVGACRDFAELDRWVRRAATVARAEDLFAG